MGSHEKEQRTTDGRKTVSKKEAGDTREHRPGWEVFGGSRLEADWGEESLEQPPRTAILVGGLRKELWSNMSFAV